MVTTQLETERLTLRPVKEDDVNIVYNCWMQNENVSRYMCWQASNDINKAREFVQFELEHLEDDKWNRWIIELKPSCEVIGTCLIFFNTEENNWDISYNFGEKYWGRGYASEAMKCVMAFAKDMLKVKECIAVHAVENNASGHVIEKLGFKYEKDIPYECNGGDVKTTGKYYRLVMH